MVLAKAPLRCKGRAWTETLMCYRGSEIPGTTVASRSKFCSHSAREYTGKNTHTSRGHTSVCLVMDCNTVPEAPIR